MLCMEPTNVTAHPGACMLPSDAACAVRCIAPSEQSPRNAPLQLLMSALPSSSMDVGPALIPLVMRQELQVSVKMAPFPLKVLQPSQVCW
jgi:hypothetical protein